MDSFEAAKVVHDRIMKLEPENIARKIIGYIFLQDLPGQEMIRLALGPDTLIQNLIHKAKSALFMGSAPVISPPISPTVNPSPLSDPSFQFNPFSPPSLHSFPPPDPFHRMTPYWDPHLVANEEFGLPNKFMGMEEPLEPVVGTCLTNEYFSTEAGFNSLGIRGCRNSLNLMDYPVKLCHYFKKGYCKHAESCRYLHVGSNPESYTNMFDQHSYNDDQVLSPGSLEKLELEITELLKSRRGSPVSIAALPMLYYEKYGRTLQAEGYLTESQRHGKSGFSLTKLLARLKNSVRLIDRPHGQHFLILAEDAPKYMEIRGERNDPGPIVSGSRQIYLTFPAESTFTEEDVSNYFRTFGPVQDVRIPCQQKRMFGFVTFESADTVKLILSKGNPHHVCGARVLVKPYREKSKLVERKYQDSFDHHIAYHSHPADMDLDLHSRWESRLRRKLMEEREQALELETMRLSQLQLARDAFASQSSLGYSMNELKLPEDNVKFPSAERFNYLLGFLNHGSTSDDNPKYPVNCCGDQESAQGLNLPDSPFASAVASSISAVI